MTIVLTICSMNYLARAKTLGDSVAEHNPDCRFVIGLVDRVPPDFDRAYWHPYELVPVEELNIDGFQDMAERYSVIELNTAVKPFYLEHLYRRHPSVQKVLYLDPDILVLGSLNGIEHKLCDHSIVVTPHSCSYDDSEANIFFEQGMLSTGVFNLGFLATSRTAETFAFLRWWQTRLRTLCYYLPGRGLFVDQKWVNLAPVYFRSVCVETDPGYNMSYWNLFERTLSRQGGRYFVNGQHHLIFYHFSGYSPLKPEILVGGSPLADHPTLTPLFDEYRAKLLDNGYVSTSSLRCYFQENAHRFQRKQKSRNGFQRAVKGLSKALLTAIPVRAQRFLNRAAQFVARSTAQ